MSIIFSAYIYLRYISLSSQMGNGERKKISQVYKICSLILIFFLYFEIQKTKILQVKFYSCVNSFVCVHIYLSLIDSPMKHMSIASPHCCSCFSRKYFFFFYRVKLLLSCLNSNLSFSYSSCQARLESSVCP